MKAKLWRRWSQHGLTSNSGQSCWPWALVSSLLLTWHFLSRIAKHLLGSSLPCNFWLRTYTCSWTLRWLWPWVKPRSQPSAWAWRTRLRTPSSLTTASGWAFLATGVWLWVVFAGPISSVPLFFRWLNTAWFGSACEEATPEAMWLLLVLPPFLSVWGSRLWAGLCQCGGVVAPWVCSHCLPTGWSAHRVAKSQLFLALASEVEPEDLKHITSKSWRQLSVTWSLLSELDPTHACALGNWLDATEKGVNITPWRYHRAKQQQAQSLKLLMWLCLRSLVVEYRCSSWMFMAQHLTLTG